MNQDEIHKYSVPLKKRIVKQVESGILSISEASREYGATKGAIKHWLTDYGRFKPGKRIVEIVMKDEKEKIAELQQALADSHLKNRFYETLIKIADKDLKTDLKKTIGPKALAASKKKGKK